jgi:hypothetical protein
MRGCRLMSDHAPSDTAEYTSQVIEAMSRTRAGRAHEEAEIDPEASECLAAMLAHIEAADREHDAELRAAENDLRALTG